MLFLDDYFRLLGGFWGVFAHFWGVFSEFFIFVKKYPQIGVVLRCFGCFWGSLWGVFGVFFGWDFRAFMDPIQVSQTVQLRLSILYFGGQSFQRQAASGFAQQDNGEADQQSQQTEHKSHEQNQRQIADQSWD